MAGKQAKTLTRQQVVAALRRARRGRYPQRDRVMILLSVKAGLRASEIAKLSWSMVLDTHRRVADSIELHDNAAKMGGGRTIPLHPDLRRALQRLRRATGIEGAVIRSERRGSRGMSPSSIVNWFRQFYADLGFAGCSSHSGRRTLSPTRLAWYSRLGEACVMSSSWRGIDQSSKPRRTSTTANVLSGG